jgi:hypothetical protein
MLIVYCLDCTESDVLGAEEEEEKKAPHLRLGMMLMNDGVRPIGLTMKGHEQEEEEEEAD